MDEPGDGVSTSTGTKQCERVPGAPSNGGRPRAWFARVHAGQPVEATSHWPRQFSVPFLVGTALCALAVMAWRASQWYPTRLFDFYPLYYGAKAWLHGGNAYQLDAVVPASDRGYQLFEVGNVYPLPAVLLILPLSFLPPTVAVTLWVGGLMVGVLLALRLSGLPSWLVLYWPVLNGINLEQYTIVILIMQIIALWAYRERRWWLLALCCALIVTKPNQGLLFALVMVLLARHWRQQVVIGGAIWGGSLLLDPHWVAEWLPTLFRHQDLTRQPVFWALAVFAIPVWLVGDRIGSAILAQFALMPFPLPATYAASAVPLTVLDDRRSKWLMPISFLWPFAAVWLGIAWAVGLTMILPMVALSVLRWWERIVQRGQFITLRPAGIPRVERAAGGEVER